METEKGKEKLGGGRSKEKQVGGGGRWHTGLVLQTAGCWCGQGHCPTAGWTGWCDPQGPGRPWIPRAAGGQGLPLLGLSHALPQGAEPRSDGSCPGCPAAGLLPDAVHLGDWQNSPRAFAAQLPGRDGSLGLELPRKAKDLRKHREA